MKPQAVLFYFALVTVLVTVSVSGGEGEGQEGEEGGGEGEGEEGEGGEGGTGKLKAGPVTCTGTYKLDTDPSDKQFTRYLKALGLNPLKRRIFQASKKVLIAIRHPNATHFNVEQITKMFSMKFIFESGKQVGITLPDGTKMTSTITVDKKKNTAKRVVKANGVKATQDIKFSDLGFAINMKAKGAKAVLRFSKIKPGPAEDQDCDAWLEGYKKEFFKD